MLESLIENKIKKNNYLLNSKKSIRILPVTEIEKAICVLKNIDIDFKPTGEEESKIGNEIACEFREVITEPLCRAVAKIAFNYLAYFNDASILLQKDFDTIRNYILWGVKPNYPLMEISNAPILCNEPTGYAYCGHIITLEMVGNFSSILCQVSLYNKFTYKICLARNYGGERLNVGKAHFFNPRNHLIYPINDMPGFIILQLEIVSPQLWIPREHKKCN